MAGTQCPVVDDDRLTTHHLVYHLVIDRHHLGYLLALQNVHVVRVVVVFALTNNISTDTAILLRYFPVGVLSSGSINGNKGS